MKPNQTEDDDDRICKDGEVVKVPMIFMQDSSAPLRAAASPITDGAQHRPGTVTLSDAERNQRLAMYEKANANLCSAWNDPSPILANEKAPAKVVVSDYYAAHDAALAEKWRTP